MRIAIGSLQCESNSLTPIHTKFEDFDYAVGEAMYGEVQVVDYFKEHKCGVVPTIYAHALPGGAVVKKDFLRLVNELVEAIPTEGIDGIWLYLHGAMYVEEIGSGDTYLLQKIRDKVGYNIPISVAMDFHADNTDEIIKLVNCVTAFRTAPHCDHKETQMERVNVVICGDAGTDLVRTAKEHYGDGGGI